MSQAQANVPPEDHGVFASYEAAVAWMDSQCDDDDSDDGALHRNITCTPAQNKSIDLTALEDDDSDNEERPNTSPAVKDEHVTPPPDSTPPTSPQQPPQATPTTRAPSTQSYFDQYSNFKPNPTSSFVDEFRRCMLSQGVVPGSKEYRRHRTKAVSHEIKFHYSQASAVIPEEEGADEEIKFKIEPGRERKGGIAGLDENSPEFRLHVYQNMCVKVGLTPRDTIAECAHDLKNTVWVNIPDFIDAYRKGAEVRTKWPSFNAFSAYCLSDDHRMDLQVAKEDEFLAVLLQTLSRVGAPPRTRRAKRKYTAAEVEPQVIKRLQFLKR